MSRKKIFLVGTAVLLVVVGVAGTLLWALLRVPDFYADASQNMPQEPAERKQAAKHLVQETTNLVNNLKHSDQWSATFKQSEINSWFVEELHQEKYADVIPEGVSDPRLVIKDEVVQLGFRFKRNGWNGIVSLRLKPWIQNENQLAIEIESIRAGIVPIPLEEMLQDLSKQLVDAGWDVTWNHANNHDVAVINLRQQKPDSPVLESLLVDEGEVRVSGRSRGSLPEQPQINQSSRTAFNR